MIISWKIDLNRCASRGQSSNGKTKAPNAKNGAGIVGERKVWARNPLAVKTLMNILGMPSGRCRPPVGKMTPNGLEKVLETARKVQAQSPEIFKPLADFFGIDVDTRLNEASYWEGLYYEAYE